MEERTIEITLQEYMELLQCRLRNETVVKLLDAEILYAPSSVGTAIKAILTGAAGVDPERAEKGQDDKLLANRPGTAPAPSTDDFMSIPDGSKEALPFD